MKLTTTQLWKVDNYNINLYNVFKWYLNFKKLYLVFYSVYSLNNFQLIYLYYYKFKRISWKGNILEHFKRIQSKRKKLFKRKWPKRVFKTLKKNKNYLIPLSSKKKIYIHRNIAKNAAQQIHNTLIKKPELNFLLTNFRNLVIINLLTFKRLRIAIKELKNIKIQSNQLKKSTLRLLKNNLKKKLKKNSETIRTFQFYKKTMPWEYRLKKKNLQKNSNLVFYKFINFLDYTQTTCSFLNFEPEIKNLLEPELEARQKFWLKKINYIKKIYVFNWSNSLAKADYFRWQTLRRVLRRRRIKRIKKLKKKIFKKKKWLQESDYKKLIRIKYKMRLKRKFPNFFSKKRVGRFKFSKRWKSKVRKYRIKKWRKRRYGIRRIRLRKYRWQLSRKKMLKTKFYFLKHYLKKYLNSSVIIFRSIRKTNPNIKKLFAKYFDFFWFFRKDKYFKDLVYSVIFSKLFLVSDMLGYMISKVFINPENQRKIMHQVKNFWEFFSFNVSLKLNIKGKWRGRPRAKERMLFIGNIKRQSASEYLDYAYFPITTIYGVFSIKIWLNKQWN